MRRTRGGVADGVSLFPFLAVLLCTLGSLVVLLVLFAQQASGHAEVAAHQKASQKEAELAALRKQSVAAANAQKQAAANAAEIAERLAEADRVRQEKLAELNEARGRLTHLEDHLRRLRDDAKLLAGQIRALEASDAASTDTERARQELADVRRAIVDATKTLQEVQKEAVGKKRAYAIIPYEGPAGTSRRPIYIECKADGIFLQPEGVKLTPADFVGPLDPGNPLDAALRAKREYLRRLDPKILDSAYPLLIVRPDGAIAYGLARTAMQSWDREFGYELVDADLELAYPARDFALTELLEQTIRDARNRQTMMMSAMPGRYRDSRELLGRMGGDARFNGDLLDLEGGTRITPRGSGSTSGQSSSPGSSPGGTVRAGERSGQMLTGTGPAGSAGANHGSNGNQGGTRSTVLTPREHEYQPRQPYEPIRQPSQTRLANEVGNPMAGNQEMASAADENLGSGGDFPTENSQNPQNSPSSASNDQNSGVASGQYYPQTGSQTNPWGQNGQPSSQNTQQNTQQNSQQTGNIPGQSASASSSVASPGNVQLNMPQQNNEQGDQQQGSAEQMPLAASRGSDWALNSRPPINATGIIRPIRVRCEVDRIIVYPESGSRLQPQVVNLNNTPDAAMEDLAIIVGQRIQGWGLPVAGGYWSPVLQTSIGPGAVDRFLQVQTLLEDSGIKVTRKEP